MIVGLTGRKQAGKNATAKLMAIHARREVVEISFAGLLKQSAAAVLGVSVDLLEGWKNNDHAVVSVGVGVEDGWLLDAKTQTIRQFLQRYGTEGHRDILGADFWVDAALPFSRDYGDGRIYVVTDVRFENEAYRVRELGGEIVRIVGPAEVENATDAHASETPLPAHWVDSTILNERRDDNYAELDFEIRKWLSTRVELAA